MPSSKHQLAAVFALLVTIVIFRLPKELSQADFSLRQVDSFEHVTQPGKTRCWMRLETASRSVMNEVASNGATVALTSSVPLSRDTFVAPNAELL